MPAHPVVVLTVLFLQNIYDTFGHLGYEFFPTWMLRNKWILAVQATPTHHDAHHRYFQGNYSHYFNVWDWLMGTELEQYAELCEAAQETTATPARANRSAGKVSSNPGTPIYHRRRSAPVNRDEKRSPRYHPRELLSS
jgi:sterol desaturase/sphingolipid hydroxylase (fatty acid hydroxylase superfamily)